MKVMALDSSYDTVRQVTDCGRVSDLQVDPSCDSSWMLVNVYCKDNGSDQRRISGMEDGMASTIVQLA